MVEKLKGEKMIEVKLLKDFSIVKETLERIGIVNKKIKRITPSCYIIHRNEKYYIAHFKTLLSETTIRKKKLSKTDINRRNAIISMLQNWNMIKIVDLNIYQDPLKEKIFVLKYYLKDSYFINHKFNKLL